MVVIDKGWSRIVQLCAEVESDKPHAKVGLVGSAADSKPAGSDLTQAEIGAAHEYGLGNNPERSWIGRTFDEQREALVSDAKRMIGLVYDGKLTTTRALGLLGAKLTAEIKKRVTAGPEIPPPNAPSTAAKKESLTRKGAKFGIRTLMDTGRMIASTTWAVVAGKKSAK